jgi:hypothetical protein
LTRVGFYIIENTDARSRQRLALRLTDKAHQRGHRIFIHCQAEAEARELDELLWTFRPASFLPHALVSDNAGEQICIMDKTFQPAEIEQQWYARWESSGYFAPQGGDEPYCIMIPPPNVTGSLHMGHGFRTTIMDALIRYHRMAASTPCGRSGTDHAGIATQMVVERQLEAEGKTGTNSAGKSFIEKIWDWKAESGGTITASCGGSAPHLDWSRERFTMDEGLSNAVQEVFIRLYRRA